MKIGKSHVFVLAVALIIIYAAFVSGSGGYCSAREFFSGRHDEEDDACIAKLIKRADAGNIYAANRLRYPHEAYIKRTCKKEVESLGERERYYFELYIQNRCEAWGFETPKSKGGEANTTSGGGNLARGDTNATDGEGNLTREGANTIHDEAGVIKGDVNSTGGSNVGR
ncbi:hypothetical protein [uncultured Campylobacter sp.]|uniref:hypothetical protein n=1 Tax=uncultured Campylobacter sp. TaxID=218934 RepID=UPI0026092C74|nr:hypothetical protein [uncultured Campylobacter sp.]